MPAERHASCSCGQLSLTTLGEPVRVSVCHCRACQRRTGSVFGVQARFPEAAVTVRGQGREYRRGSDDGHRITQCFCPVCGTTVCYRNDSLPGMVGVPVGGFADPAFPPPVVSVYGERRHLWVKLPEGIVDHE